MAFGQLFGFVGILVAIPAAAASLVALRHLKTHWINPRSAELAFDHITLVRHEVWLAVVWPIFPGSPAVILSDAARAATAARSDR
jgi:hypothetical protein